MEDLDEMGDLDDLDAPLMENLADQLIGNELHQSKRRSTRLMFKSTSTKIMKKDPSFTENPSKPVFYTGQSLL